MTNNLSLLLVIIFVVIIIETILFSLQQFQYGEAQNELIYENKVFGLKIPYPFGWSLNERNIEPDGTGYIEFSDLSNQSSINIGNT